MARHLLWGRAMKILRLLIVLLALPLATARAQETEPPDGTRIVSALVSGLDFDRLSPGLQQDINKLAGTPLNRQLLRELAARIEAEQPKYIAGVRVSPDPDGARVVFVVAPVLEQQREADVNTRYVVEDVELKGIPERDLSQALRDDLHALVGKPLDSDEADRLESRLKSELPDHDVSRRTVRGSQRGQIKVVFTANRAEWSRWLRFEPADANAIYHSEQGWGANLPISMNGRDFNVTPIIAWDIGDELIEEYSGFALRFESRKLVSERFGVFFEWSTFDQTWRDPTLAALALDPRIPAPYRNRMSVTPLLKFAITRQLTVAGGVRITELDPLVEPGISQMANAAIGSVSFSERSRQGSGPRQDLEAAFTVRAGTRSLESDLVYERYLGQADYLYRWGKHEVRASGMAGGISGDAPLFERFSLGDSRTLRGWDKYDIAPAGGNRMFHTSFEYQYQGLGMFLDVGSVWDHGVDSKLRVSTGVTFNPGPVFFTVGFPVNTDEFRAVFMMGLRFRAPSAGIKKY
jgi:surface antigen Omp85-like protein